MTDTTKRVYPKTLAASVIYNDKTTVSDLVSTSVYVDDTEQIETTELDDTSPYVSRAEFNNLRDKYDTLKAELDAIKAAIKT